MMNSLMQQHVYDILDIHIFRTVYLLRYIYIYMYVHC